MKTHTIKTPKAELMVVELPENIESDYSLIYGTAPEETYLSFRKNAGFKPPRKSEKLENGIWMVLGKPDEISEEDAREFVERIGVGDPSYQGDWFVNYQDDEYMFETAKESLLSLLESEIYWENPIPTPEIQGGYDEFGNFHGGWDDNWISAFEEAEQKTFDRNRSLIFKKTQSPTPKI